MNFRSRYNHIRLVEGTDPNATGTGMGGSEGQNGGSEATSQQEPTITQAQLVMLLPVLQTAANAKTFAMEINL